MFDPVSVWMQGTVMWMKVFKQQQDSYLRLLGAFAQKIPHENSRELARDADAVKASLPNKSRGAGSVQKNTAGGAEPKVMVEDNLLPV